MLGLHDRAVRLAHAPRALREHDASEPCTPLLARISVRPPEGAKLRDRLKEHPLLPPSDGKVRVSVSKKLEARDALANANLGEVAGWLTLHY